MNRCWYSWKTLFLGALDRHVPTQYKRKRGYSIPWKTPQIKNLIRYVNRHNDFAIRNKSSDHRNIYKRNVTKLILSYAKKPEYFMGRLHESFISNDFNDFLIVFFIVA